MFRSLAPWTRDAGTHLSAFQQEMNRLFEDFWTGLPTTSSPFRPSFEMVSDPEAYHVKAELPGMGADDVKCELHGRVLMIEGEKKEAREEKKDDETWFSERRYGHFRRSIPLPEDALGENIDARFEKGVLTVKIARDVEARAEARKIPVSG